MVWLGGKKNKNKKNSDFAFHTEGVLDRFMSSSCASSTIRQYLSRRSAILLCSELPGQRLPCQSNFLTSSNSSDVSFCFCNHSGLFFCPPKTCLITTAFSLTASFTALSRTVLLGCRQDRHQQLYPPATITKVMTLHFP